MKRIMTFLSVMTLSLIGLGGVAQAEAPPDCKTTVTNLNRPDHGHGTINGGYWANLSIKRTTTICVVVPDVSTNTVQPPAEAHYKATVKDVGTFVTIAGATLSPNNAAALAGGTNGKVLGGFTQDFEGAAGWLKYHGNYNGQTYSGINNPVLTGKWVEGVYGGDDFKSRRLNDDWSWRYWTCAEELKSALEFWWDAADPASSDGTTEAAGDITGKACPATPTPTPTPSASASATTPVVSLPVTGSQTSALAFVGGAAVLVGVIVLLFSLLRRRIRFEA